MATPAFRAVSAKVTDATSPFSQSVALPTGTAVDDICILIATTEAGGTLSISSAGGGAWTAFANMPVTVTGGAVLHVWWRRHASGDTAPTVDSSADHLCATMSAYSGVVGKINPVHQQAVGSEATSDTSFSFATGLTSTRNNCLVVCIYSSTVDSNTGQAGTPANTSLASVNLRAEYETNSGGGSGFALADGTKNTAGTLGTWTDTMVSATPKTYVTFALMGGAASTVTTPVTINIGTSGAARKTGTVTSPFTVAVATAGVRKRFGATAVPVTVTIGSAGIRTVPGSSSLPVTLNIFSDGTVTPGSTTHFGSGSLELLLERISAGVVTRLGAASVPVSFQVGSLGHVGTFGVSSLPITVSTVTAGGRETFAGVSLSETLDIVTIGSRGAFGSASLPLLLDIVTRIGPPFGSATLDIAFDAQTVGARLVFGSVSLASAILIATLGEHTATGTVALPIVFAIDTSTGQIITLPVIATGEIELGYLRGGHVDTGRRGTIDSGRRGRVAT